MAPVRPVQDRRGGVNYAAPWQGVRLRPRPPEPLIFPIPQRRRDRTGRSLRLPLRSKQVDFEAEIAVVIGRRARRCRRAAPWTTCWATPHERRHRPRFTEVRRAMDPRQGVRRFAPFAGRGSSRGCRRETSALKPGVNGKRRQKSSTRRLFSTFPPWWPS
ncbi:MAG: fumarylacetoacetate hydrolase family protein [Elusimicrobia bacterium]|nr:fumarylacetoacetate hydrolase family protein [Elusimicrobiota bacterium]